MMMANVSIAGYTQTPPHHPPSIVLSGTVSVFLKMAIGLASLEITPGQSAAQT